MYHFSKTSENHLVTCHAALRLVARTVIQSYNCRIIWGHRGEDDQNKAYFAGNSTKMFPESKHNKMPSLAMDIIPYPINWNNLNLFWHLGGRILQIADLLDIKLIWGRDWDRDNDFTDQTLMDYAHYELVNSDLNEENYLTVNPDVKHQE